MLKALAQAGFARVTAVDVSTAINVLREGISVPATILVDSALQQATLQALLLSFPQTSALAEVQVVPHSKDRPATPGRLDLREV